MTRMWKFSRRRDIPVAFGNVLNSEHEWHRRVARASGRARDYHIRQLVGSGSTLAVRVHLHLIVSTTFKMSKQMHQQVFSTHIHALANVNWAVAYTQLKIYASSRKTSIKADKNTPFSCLLCIPSCSEIHFGGFTMYFGAPFWGKILDLDEWTHNTQ